jgi:hypothetical protein
MGGSVQITGVTGLALPDARLCLQKVMRGVRVAEVAEVAIPDAWPSQGGGRRWLCNNGEGGGACTPLFDLVALKDFPLRFFALLLLDRS